MTVRPIMTTGNVGERILLKPDIGVVEVLMCSTNLR
jgi:hypothetical protein